MLYHLFGRHLDTGLAAPYSDDHWRQTVSRLGLSKHQVGGALGGLYLGAVCCVQSICTRWGAALGGLHRCVVCCVQNISTRWVVSLGGLYLWAVCCVQSILWSLQQLGGLEYFSKQQVGGWLGLGG